jgi:ATP-dependent 26S proteasome regulatory subunit
MIQKNIKKEIDDKINLGFILSKLDGIGNYNGIIFIACTNHLDKLDKALYRDGRLSLIHFDYLSNIEANNIIQKIYSTKINLNIKNPISHSTFINLINQSNNLDHFISLYNK